ncbi:MAG: hypothetical protein U1F29_16885 [Planctomycetota bacterium]
MNSTLRWNLLLGCAVLAVIQLPDDAEVLAQDLEGPYCGSTAPCVDVHGPAADGAESAGWQTAANEFDPARMGADSEAIFDDEGTDDFDGAERSDEP